MNSPIRPILYQPGATVLDRDNQHLATGQAKLSSDLSEVLFAPTDVEQWDEIRVRAYTLKMSDGQGCQIRCKLEHPNTIPPHFHFEILM